MEKERDEIEIDLREIFLVLKKRFLVILLTAVIFAAAAGAYSFYVAELGADEKYNTSAPATGCIWSGRKIQPHGTV